MSQGVGGDLNLGIPNGDAQQDAGVDPNAGADPNMGMDMSQGAQPDMNGGQENPYDSNFDAGVEADEDEDPQKFIQQLTGKLSQSLNSYASEVGDDQSTFKYVGKMITRACAKGLDDAGRKELIKTIKLAGNEEETPEQEGQPEDNGDELMEGYMTKASVKKLAEEFNKFCSSEKEERVEDKPKRKKRTNSPFKAKKF